jgi:hypothetical protein
MEFHIMAIKKSSSSGIPFGNNAGRPANPGIGRLYSNGEAQRLELYTESGWNNIVQEVPGVSSISGTYIESENSNTIVIYGTNFATGAVAYAIGTDAVQVPASSTTFNSLVQLTAVFSGLSPSQEPYDIKVQNPSNLFGLIPDALYINNRPAWQTAAGSLGSFDEEVLISLNATAVDPESVAVTYALANGSTLPAGVALNSSTGVISGTLPNIETDTTYTFTINASDGVNEAVPRQFSITSKYTIPTESLVVAGGGGGAGRHAGGGGGAGVIFSLLAISQNSSHLIKVGNGGLGATNNSANSPAYNGETSIFSSVTALGGGIGGDNDTAASSGGSGGGGNGGSNPTGGSGTVGQGNNGGLGGGSHAGGGGGGAGSVGGNHSGQTAGNGGNGLASSITGTSITYGGGGGGGGWSSPNFFGYGGTGGGGAGSASNGTEGDSTVGVKARSGTNGLGGGGGGGGIESGPNGGGGNGGSGAVIIAYPNTYPAITTIPGTLTYDQPTRAGYRVYRFTAGTGTITF